MDLTEDKARQIMGGGLGKAELEFVTSIAAPLWWVEPGPPAKAHNGSAFFIDAGEGVFGVTAAHVIDGYLEARRAGIQPPLQLGSGHELDLAGRNSIIDSDLHIDIATFRISHDEVAAVNKTVFQGSQRSWPPLAPQQDRGVIFAGYPGAETLWDDPQSLCFGAAPGGGVASSVSERDICTQLARESWIDVLGLGLPKENFNFAGISGGPMLMVIERAGIRSFALAGVIYQGPAIADDPSQAIPGFEVIRARRARFIRADGTLDRNQWYST